MRNPWWDADNVWWEREGEALLTVKENQIKEPWSTYDQQLLTEKFLLQVTQYCAGFGRLTLLTFVSSTNNEQF